jgi:hypothetical protein
MRLTGVSLQILQMHHGAERVDIVHFVALSWMFVPVRAVLMLAPASVLERTAADTWIFSSNALKVLGSGP